MRYFYLIETIPLTLSVLIYIIQLILIIYGINDFDHIIFQIIGFIWVLYPLFQAYGMLKLKDSKDPLNRISKLYKVLILSRNQIKLESFKQRLTSQGNF